MKVRNPRTGEYDYEIAPLNVAALETRIAELRAAQPAWAALPVEERARALEDFAAAIERHGDAIADALTIDTGRAAISRVEVNVAAATLRRWAASAAAVIDRHRGVPTAAAIPGIETATRLVPYPLVGGISPWNFPLLLAMVDVSPALAAGCAAIVKPSEITPRFIKPLLAALAEVPTLANVLAIIEGDGATGAALVERVDFITFTGSVATGRKVGEAAARAFIPASLELGGKDPMIVLTSADPATAAATALRASVANAGQACQSIERVYVAREIAAPFLSILIDQASAVRFNFPDINTGDIGPFIHAPQAEIVATQIADAVAKGAVIQTGGTVKTLGGGLYLAPTILTDVTPDMTVISEETFGPVIPVTIFDTVDEAIHLANAGIFGLSASVLAATVEEAEAVAVRLNAGAVSINDGGLTAMVWEREKSSFGLSGIGPSRMGDTGLTRFFRRQALLRQHGTPAALSAIAEDA